MGSRDDGARPPETERELGLGAAEGTPMVLEAPRIASGEPWCTVAVAGLQYRSYGIWDDVLEREILPALGDRLELQREPDNAHDCNAVRVLWRNGQHWLGYVPRAVAADLAPRLDAGLACRAYVWDPGQGGAWELRALLVGAACEPVHRLRWERHQARLVQEGAAEVWGGPETGWAPYEGRWQWRAEERRPQEQPTARQAAAAAAWEARRAAARRRREAEAAAAFAAMPVDLPPGATEPVDEALRDRTFIRWADVPAGLKTKTQLRELGLKPGPGATAFASFSGRDWYDLWLVADAVPLRTAARRGREPVPPAIVL